jgi:ribosomal protein S18 acetylase RimI-like enzyme
MRKGLRGGVIRRRRHARSAKKVEKAVPELGGNIGLYETNEDIMTSAISPPLAQVENTPVSIRTVRAEDVEVCGRVAYAAHSSAAAAHNVPCEQPSVEFSIELIGNKVKDENAVGFVAEKGEQIIGSVFLNTFTPSLVAAIGPLTVDPSMEGSGVGRLLMQAVLNAADAGGLDCVRLVQSPSHLRSLALYAKLGFDVREPLVLVSGDPKPEKIEGRAVREATPEDAQECDQLCAIVHGFTRKTELVTAMARRSACVVERAGNISGYSTGLGFRGHAVGETTDDLKAMIANTSKIMGPGFFVPLRNGKLIRWLFDRGFRAHWPANLMTKGPYQESTGAFLPSIAF